MKTANKWIIAIIGAAIIVWMLHLFAFTSCLIPSAGMENALFQGERIIVNKWSSGLRRPFMTFFPYRRWLEKKVKQGEVVVFNNPANTLQPIIDRREIFISRCIGTPGDTLSVTPFFSIVPSPDTQTNPDKKSLYSYPGYKEKELHTLLQSLSITGNKMMGSNDNRNVRSFSRYEYYLLQQAIKGDSIWLIPFPPVTENDVQKLVIPSRGKPVKIESWNVTLFGNTIMMHEKKQAEVIDDILYVDGEPVSEYTFSQDYYWMVSNNSINPTDSRLFGLVPQNHIIGKALFIWFSKEKDTGMFQGYRRERFFKKVF